MSSADNDAAINAPFAMRLLRWFDVEGRKHLPWQQDISPYRVWISEIMLQQTQVSTVIPYFERFMQRFPAIGDLAAADIDEVLHLWTGLGYYARARNLHCAAKIVMQDHAGEFPRTLETVQALPGIGRSTAGAILSIAGNQRQPILDGNVKRVLTRHLGVHGFPGEKRIESQLWVAADMCTPHQRVADYTQAIMDLGATVCTRARPNCSRCPVSRDCIALRENLQSQLPTRRPKRERPSRVALVLIARNHDGAILLERRPPTGIWGGLWTFPQFEERQALDAYLAVSGLAKVEPIQESEALIAMPSYHHAFSHFDLELQPLLLRTGRPFAIADDDRYCWYDPMHPKRIGLATPVRDIISQLVLQS
jgi:A/G-specific adenine glycosylase